MNIRIELAPKADIGEVERLWRPLAERAYPSFFLSWHWVGCWLAESGVRPDLLIAHRQGEVIGLAALGRRRRFWFLPSLSLTASGVADQDSVFVEYNGVLCRPSDRHEVEAALARFLASRPLLLGSQAWCRMDLPGVEPGLARALAAAGLATRVRVTRPSPFIDLAAIRSAGTAYLATRSRNARGQIGRAIRLYQTMGGEFGLERVEGVPAMLEALGQLETLHQEAWTRRGQPGAFAGEFFTRFHCRLVREAGGTGHVDLVRFKAGGDIQGCLYNFVYNGRAYSYQSGFRFTPDHRLKPGLAAHTLAAQRYLELGLDRYLLLAGEARYKTTLATDEDQLDWLEVTRPRPVALFIESLRKAARPNTPCQTA